MASIDLAGRTIVLTGASAGIGAKLAPLLTAKGAHVVLAARTKSKLHKVADDCPGPGETLVAVADITKRADHQSLMKRALEWKGSVWAWVNNAGVGMSRPALELTDEDLDTMFLINTKGPMYGMQVAVPHFKAAGEGHLINVSSMLGRVPFASGRAGYSAAKHALNSLTCNVRVDLQNQGYDKIYVSTCSPGPVATDFGLNAVHGGGDNRALPGCQPVEEVAEVMLALLEAPRAEAYTRPQYREVVGGYFSAERVEEIEARPPFAAPAFAGGATK